MLYANRYISEKGTSFNGLCFQLDLINIHVLRFSVLSVILADKETEQVIYIILLSCFVYSHHHNTHS